MVLLVPEFGKDISLFINLSFSSQIKSFLCHEPFFQCRSRPWTLHHHTLTDHFIRPPSAENRATRRYNPLPPDDPGSLPYVPLYVVRLTGAWMSMNTSICTRPVCHSFIQQKNCAWNSFRIFHTPRRHCVCWFVRSFAAGRISPRHSWQTVLTSPGPSRLIQIFVRAKYEMMQSHEIRDFASAREQIRPKALIPHPFNWSDTEWFSLHIPQFPSSSLLTYTYTSVTVPDFIINPFQIINSTSFVSNLTQGSYKSLKKLENPCIDLFPHKGHPGLSLG
jgi:hypothetical protein